MMTNREAHAVLTRVQADLHRLSEEWPGWGTDEHRALKEEIDATRAEAFALSGGVDLEAIRDEVRGWLGHESEHEEGSEHEEDR